LKGKPIFIVGSGRCGSTALYRIIAKHPHLAFLTQLADRMSRNIKIQRLLMRAWDIPVLGETLRIKLVPAEGHGYWRTHLGIFRHPYRDIGPEDVTNEMRRRFHHIINELTTEKRRRVLIKVVSWTRVGFIKEIFPDSKIIHVQRHPFAVVNSLINVPWWTGWEGPENWGWGPLDEHENEVWQRHDQSFLVLALILWKKVIQAHRLAVEKLPGEFKRDVMEIEYKRLCEDKLVVIPEILSFCDLEYSDSYRRKVEEYHLQARDYKWRESFTNRQKSDLLQAAVELGVDKLWPNLEQGGD
jgi:hypothetical protein